jgi:hypothetical protein
LVAANVYGTLKKTAMKLRFTIIFIMILTAINCKAQQIDSIKIKQIDSLISLIPQNPIDNDYYIPIKACGSIDKKILGIFKKQVGIFSSTTIYHDTIVFWTSNVYQYKKDFQILIEDFYYNNDRLIKYSKYLTINPDNKQKILKQRIVAYFDNKQLIHLNDSINDNFKYNDSEILKTISKSDIELETNKESIKFMNNTKVKCAPIDNGLNIKRQINN